MRGKRFIAIIVTVILLLLSLTSSLSALDASATANAEVAMNPMQMSLFKFSARQKGMDVYETARAILRQVGYPESIIKAMPEDKLLQVADSRRIETKEEYVCISPDGEVISKSREEYEIAKKNLSDIALLEQETSSTTTLKWATLTTYVMQSKVNRTQYAYSATCVWLTTPFWRMNDYITIGTMAGAVDGNSVTAALTYTEVDHDTHKTTDRYVEKLGQSQIEVEGTTANCYFDLPNNTVVSDKYGGLTGIEYQNFIMFIYIQGEMTDDSSSVPFNVGSAYFHQILKVTSNATINVNAVGAGLSFSIKPAISFNKISNSMKWTHRM